MPSVSLQLPESALNDVMSSLNPANNPQSIAQALVERGVSSVSHKMVVNDIFFHYMKDVIDQDFGPQKDAIYPFMDNITCFFQEIYGDIIKPYVKIMETEMIEEAQNVAHFLGVLPTPYDAPKSGTILQKDDYISLEDIRTPPKNSEPLMGIAEKR